MESAGQSVRIDKWLWAVRIYKSRSIASDACATGKVQVNGQPAKPSRSVRTGDVITAVAGEVLRTVKVISLLEKRVGAKLVAQFLEDLTPIQTQGRVDELNPRILASTWFKLHRFSSPVQLSESVYVFLRL